MLRWENNDIRGLKIENFRKFKRIVILWFDYVRVWFIYLLNIWEFIIC